MISTIDRYILRALIMNYCIAVSVMISLYVTLDMFVNMDEFTEQGYPLLTVMGNIFSYYWPNIFLYFAQLSGAITLFSCMAVLARMRRLNELTAILASGVSLYRVARPIVLFGICTGSLLVIDTEIIIPSVAHLLARDHDDVDGKRTYEVLFLKDDADTLFSAAEFHPRTRDLKRLLILIRGENGSVIETIEADSAVWEKPVAKGQPGRWVLTRGQRMRKVFVDRGVLGEQIDVEESLIQYYESGLGPEQILLRQAEGWIQFLSLGQLSRLENSQHVDRANVLRAKHQRVTSPIMSLVLLLLGLPFFLDRSPTNVLSDAGKCLVACGSCFFTNFVGQSMRPEIDSAFLAWLPIFIFATVGMVLIDRIRT